METRYTGETIPISVIISGLSDLVSFVSAFGIKHRDSHYVTKKTPTVDLNTLNVVLDPEDTDKAGIYDYEFRISVDGYVDSVYKGELELIDSVIKGVV